MIIDHPHPSDEMSTTKDASLNPPSYDAATGSAGPSSGASKPQPTPITPMSQKSGYPYDAGCHQIQSQSMDMNAQPPVQVYHYKHPVSGHIITTCLPPDHPEMICLQQGHLTETRYGLLGVLAAIIWFPIGIALCCLDRRVHCRRCGHVIEDGFSC